MLNLDAAVQIRGLSLFRDFNDPQLYWYMPNSPRLAREGRDPLFQLLMYRDDATPPSTGGDTDRGGGFLTMTVDLGVSDTVLEEVRSELSSVAGGRVRLAPVPFESGSVRVTALGVAGGAAGGFRAGGGDDEAATPARFVEQILGFTKPSMYGDNRAAFSFELSQRGAKLMEASLEDDGASAIAVCYELEYMGLLPAREVKIVIEYQQSYRHLRTRAQANTLWFKTDIDLELERMRQSGSIQIEDVNYMELPPDQASARAQELQTLAKELAQWTFFKPALRPGNVLAAERGNLQVYDPTAAAVAHTAGFTTPLDLLPGGRNRPGDGPVVNPGVTERTGGVRGTEAAGSTAGGTTAGGTTAGGTTAGGTTTPGGTATGQPREPTAVERWNMAGRPQAGFLLRELDQNESQRIEFNLRQVSAHRRSAAPQGSIRLLAGDSDLHGRIKRVDLNDPFWQTIAGTITSNADFESAGVVSMVVAVRYGVRPDGTGPKDSKEFVLEKAGDEGTYEFFLDHLKTVELEYRVTVNYRADYAIGSRKTKAESEWIRTSTRNLDIDPRELRAVLPVRVTAGQVDWEAVQSLQTTISYRDPRHGVDAARTVTISQSDSSAVVPIRPEDAAIQQYVVTSTYFYADARETVEETRSRGLEVVLNQPPSKAVPVSVSAQDPMQRLAKVTVELSYTPEGGPEQRKLVTLTGGETVSWSFFRPSLQAEARYRYRATLFGKDGTTDQGEWIETTERQLIVGDRFPGMLDVEVQVVGDLAAAGIQIARVKLVYPGAPEGIDNREERALRGIPEPFRWIVPSRTREPAPYEWEVMWVFSNRSVTVDKGTADDELLFLFVPTPE